MVSSKELLAVLCLLASLSEKDKKDIINRLSCSQDIEGNAEPLFSFQEKAEE